jgi:predicted enzyme involved in methoxymalonyl-ACP biosynthesis
MESNMKTFTQLKKNLKKEVSTLGALKVAVLGDTATQFLVQAVKGESIDKNINLDIWEANYDQIERQVLDPTSELYQFSPEIIIIFKSSHKLLSKYNKLKLEKQVELAISEMKSIR